MEYRYQIEAKIDTNDERKEKEFEDNIQGYQPRTFQPGSINSRRGRAILPDCPLDKSDTRLTLLLVSVHYI